MKVIIKFLGIPEITIDVNSKDTIGKIKWIIYEETGYLNYCPDMTYLCMFIDKKRKLFRIYDKISDYDIKDGDTIYCSLKLGGCGYGPDN